MSGWISALRFIGVGVYVGLSIFLGVYFGGLLDSRLHTEPLLTLIGLFLGLAVAVIGVYRMLKSIIQDAQENDRKGK